MTYINKLRLIMSESFNYHLDFYNFTDIDFLNFVNDFLKGKTEYYKDEYFIKHDEKEVINLLNQIH